MNIVKIAVICAALFLLSLSLSGAANAHDAGRWYPWLWPDNVTVDYGMDYSYPNDAAYENRVIDGDDQWSNIGGTAEPNFTRFLSRGQYGTASDCQPLDTLTGAIYMENLDYYSPDTLGLATVCDGGDANRRINSFTIAFDTAEDRDWYTGTGDAYDGFLGTGLDADPDLWSVASHEWGHVTGHIGSPNGGHWYEDWAICPDGNYRHTMCPGVAPGSEMMRTLEEHDRHTFVSAY